jgi:hypothetical protein
VSKALIIAHRHDDNKVPKAFYFCWPMMHLRGEAIHAKATVFVMVFWDFRIKLNQQEVAAAI